MKVMDIVEGRMKTENPEAYEHSMRVGNLTMLTCVILNMPKDEAELYQTAGFVHDIGKLKDTSGVFKSSDTLWETRPGESEEEFKLRAIEMRKNINRHVDAVDMIVDCEDYHTEYANAIAFHHNDYNGGGYCKDSVKQYPENPEKNLVGDNIPYVAQVIHSVDVYDAIVSSRSYKDNYTLEKTRQKLREEAEQGKQNRKLVGIMCEQLSEKWHTMSPEDMIKPMSYEKACSFLGITPQHLLGKLEDITNQMGEIHEKVSELNERVDVIEANQEMIIQKAEKNLESMQEQENSVEL